MKIKNNYYLRLRGDTMINYFNPFSLSDVEIDVDDSLPEIGIRLAKESLDAFEKKGFEALKNSKH